MVPARLTAVTLGARDIDRLRSFYKAFGWTTAFEAEDFACFEISGALLCLFPAERLAADGGAELAPHAPGMRGFSLIINVDTPEEVDATIEAAREAGARITKEPVDAEEFDGRSAYFADPEDNHWEVACLLNQESAVAAALRRARGLE